VERAAGGDELRVGVQLEVQQGNAAKRGLEEGDIRDERHAREVPERGPDGQDREEGKAGRELQGRVRAEAPVQNKAGRVHVLGRPVSDSMNFGFCLHFVSQ